MTLISPAAFAAASYVPGLGWRSCLFLYFACPKLIITYYNGNLGGVQRHSWCNRHHS